MFTEITSTRKEFTQQLKIAKKIFASWPKWKQEIPCTAIDMKKCSDFYNNRKNY